MLRGIYTATSGMLAESLRMDVSSNNLANVDTAGYQKQTAHVYSYPARPVNRIHRNQQQTLGTFGTGVFVNGSGTSFAPGTIRTTHNPLDVAIIGHGFFVIQTPEGNRYTRDGRFSINHSGLLTTLDGNLVRGEHGPIYVGEGEVLLDERGDITVNGEWVDRLLFVEFNDRTGLTRQGAGLFEASVEAGEPFRYRASIAPGALESANVNVVTEMVNLITIQRAYEANQKVVQSYDETLGKLINEL